MKIGVLTLPLWNNYGGIIQAYALQKILINEGHEVSLIDYHHPIPSSLKLIRNSLVRSFKKNFLKRKDVIFYPNYYQKKIISKYTRDFIGKEINPITKELYNFNDLKELNSEFDAFVVGSDQVWRPIYTPNIENYFFDFVDKDKIKIAYAASFGTDKWEFTMEQYLKCKSLIQDFKAVSVRESSGVFICREKFETKVLKVLDPSMLLDKVDYFNLCEKYQTQKSDGNLFTYILDESEHNLNIIKSVSSILGLKSFKVMPKRFDDQFKSHKEDYFFPPLTKWIKAFEDAEFIIADSFHGCVFSIIFNKPFIAIGNQERGLTRFYSLLEKFQLSDRLILSEADLNDDLINKPIDWNTVNSILEENKKISLQFLKKNFE